MFPLTPSHCFMIIGAFFNLNAQSQAHSQSVYARNSEPTQNSDPNGIPTSVLRISERNSEPHGIPTGKLRRGGLRDHMTKAIYIYN